MERAGEGIGGSTLPEVMGRLSDPRSGHGRRNQLGAILGLAVCAILCGCRSLYAISQWCRDQGLEVSGVLAFARERTPWVYTRHLVFSRLDSGGLRTAAEAMAGGTRVEGCGGLGRRREAVERDPRRAVAWSPPVGGLRPSVGREVGQQAVARKRNELEAVYQLLGPAGPEGPSGDGRCPVHPAGGISEDSSKRGHYFFSVKDNQPTLKQDFADLWADLWE